MLASDSLLEKATIIRRCGPLVQNVQQHGAVAQCWYTWVVGEKDILSEYVALGNSKQEVVWINSPNYTTCDSLVSGSYYIRQNRKDLTVVNIEKGFVSTITFKTNGAFTTYDFSLLVACRLPIVVGTRGVYYAALHANPSGWDIEVESEMFFPDGSNSYVRGCYTDSIMKTLMERE